MKKLILVLALSINGFGQLLPFPGPGLTGLATCGAPNYCSPTNTNIDQTAAPAALLGLNGFNNKVADPATGNMIIRATDYSMNGGSNTTAFFRVNSDSNDNVWSNDDQMFGVFRGGAALLILAFNPATQVVTPKGIGLGNGDAVNWSYATPATYYGNSGSILQKYTINTSSPTWTGSSSATTNLAAAFTTTNIVDLSAGGCTGLTFNKYAQVATAFVADSADRWISFATRIVADQGYQMFLYDSTRGCHWVDIRTMTQGGAWGTGALTFANSILLPSPIATTLTGTTGGSLINGHQYTVCIAYEKNTVGETPCSGNSSITMSGGNNAFTVTPPAATPSGTVTVPTGFNVYACDNTAVPGCAPTQQSNGTATGGVLAQPTGGSLACVTNCSGSVNYTMWVVANSANASSPYSAAITSTGRASLASFTLSINQVTNATTYDVYCDFQFVKCLSANAGTCSAGVCTITVNTNPNSVGMKIAWDETVKIAVTPTIQSMQTTTQVAQTTNGSGVTYHDLKNDGSGWLRVSFPVGAQAGPSYNGNPNMFIDTNTSTVLFMSNTSTPAINAGKFPIGHQVAAFGKIMGADANSTHPVVYTLNDSSTTVEASKYFLSNTFSNATDQHLGAQVRAGISNAPWYVGADGDLWQSHAIPNTYMTGYVYAIQDVANTALFYKFCQNWESGLAGPPNGAPGTTFNSQVSGHQSPDGKFVLFSSDMGIGGAGVTSGQLGAVNGSSTCIDADTTGLACRTDIFICVTR